MGASIISQNKNRVLGLFIIYLYEGTLTIILATTCSGFFIHGPGFRITDSMMVVETNPKN